MLDVSGFRVINPVLREVLLIQLCALWALGSFDLRLSLCSQERARANLDRLALPLRLDTLAAFVATAGNFRGVDTIRSHH